MAKRIRMTQRSAAQPPASYGWEPEHPAHKADPEVDAYLIDNDGNGTGSEPSDFAEDVSPGPYAQGPAPASYGWDPDHPAAKADAKGAAPSEKKAAMQRMAAEKKAAKCIRIAQAMLGNVDADTIEDQAVDLMDLSNSAINATMDRLSAAFLADEDESDVEAYSRAQNDAQLGYGGMEAGDDADMVAEEMLAAMLAEEDEAEAGYGLMSEEDEAEAGLFAEDEAEAGHHMAEDPEACGTMNAEEGMEAGDEEVEAMLAEMLAPEPALDLAPQMDELESDPSDMGMMEDPMDAEIGLEMMAEDDPMGLSAEDGDDAEASDEVLAQLFGGKVAGDDEDEEEDEEDEEEEDEEEEKAEKKASSNRRPKVRKASKGARSLGSVTKAATSEVNDLSKLWTMAPDVSDVFGK